MLPVNDPEVAKLIWRPLGEAASSSDFDSENGSSWQSGSEAIREAVKTRDSASGGSDQPWIKVGETIYSPEQIEALWQADVEGRAKTDEAMKGDQPWE